MHRGISAARAHEAAQRCTGRVATVLAAIADDELRHASLAWSIVGWAVRHDPRAVSAVSAAVSRWRLAIASRPGSDEHGIVSSTTMNAIALEVADAIVRPTLAILLAA